MDEPPVIEPDKTHPCGCVTYWHHWLPSLLNKPPALYFRTACRQHRTYAGRLGVIVAA